MAKKKTTTTVEEVDETTETPIDYTKDIADKSFEQVAESPKDEPKEEVKEDEKPVEEETETVEFDPEELKREAVAQAKEELSDLLKGDTKEETKDNVDEYQEYQEKFFKDNSRQPTWFEVAKFMEGKAVEKLEAKQAEKEKQADEKANQEKETLNRNNEQTNKYVEDTMNDLYANDKLPKIQNKDDTDDYGLKVRNALFKTVIDINSKRIEDKLPPKTLKEIFYEDFKIPARDVAGADAPVNMGRGGYTPDETQEMDYREIAGPTNTFRNILNRARGSK